MNRLQKNTAAANIHHLPVALVPAKRTKPQRQRKITKTEIERAICSARDLGLTIYGVTIEGSKIHLVTKPNAEQCRKGLSEVDAFFESENG
jgi:hypothetical protein